MSKVTETNPSFRIEFDREVDGRWIAEIPKLPGVMVYGRTKREAELRVTALALRVIADSLEDGDYSMSSVSNLFNHGVARH